MSGTLPNDESWCCQCGGRVFSIDSDYPRLGKSSSAAGHTGNRSGRSLPVLSEFWWKTFEVAWSYVEQLKFFEKPHIRNPWNRPKRHLRSWATKNDLHHRINCVTSEAADLLVWRSLSDFSGFPPRRQQTGYGVPVQSRSDGHVSGHWNTMNMDIWTMDIATVRDWIILIPNMYRETAWPHPTLHTPIPNLHTITEATMAF